MIASVLVSARRRDFLHQTPIEAQPPRSGGAGPQARGSRNCFVPSYRPIQRVDLWTRRSRSVVRGLGGGAEQSPLILHDLDGRTERERVSNPSDTLPGLLTRDPECALRRMGLPKGEVLDGLARRARVSRRAHPFPSLNGLSQCDIGGNGHLNGVVVEVCDDSAPVFGLVGSFLQGWQVVLGVGVLDVSEQLAALPGEEQALAQQVASRSHLSGIDIGIGKVAAAQQGGDLVGVEPVVLRLAAVDGLHVQSVAEDELDPLLAAQVGDPVPAEQALDGDDQILSVGGEGLQKLLCFAGHLPVDQGIALLVQDAEIEAASMKIDSAVMNMLSGVESHRGLLSWFSQPTAYRGGRLKGASNQYPGRSSGRKPQTARFPRAHRHQRYTNCEGMP